MSPRGRGRFVETDSNAQAMPTLIGKVWPKIPRREKAKREALEAMQLLLKCPFPFVGERGFTLYASYLILSDK